MSNITETSISGLYLISLPTHIDDRGLFREVFHLDELEQATRANFTPKQWNHSLSRPKVIRALHAENWNKLVYPVTGKIFSAIADIRPDLSTFGKVETFIFDTDKEHQTLFIGNGLANSICVIGDEPVHYIYLVDAYYNGLDTRAIAWDDPDLNIDWPIKDPLISERDQNNPTLRDLFPGKFPRKEF